MRSKLILFAGYLFILLGVLCPAIAVIVLVKNHSGFLDFFVVFLISLAGIGFFKTAMYVINIAISERNIKVNNTFAREPRKYPVLNEDDEPTSFRIENSLIVGSCIADISVVSLEND
ncbi:hypothetical protein [Gallionella capsiferriformans]|uniref:Uncharacterized protein n=1 Tax=Gallionella capsiferriformans (strain ES-2) TaxID=395494 RepID=D9SHF9_GALCS|nr:hypothetical protein [Gallionella capsiferriformans]ADL55956.1 hypothetical protein Galf_1950 [Gallionella capsiferriformans ES-2]